jgi:hypothetical protein
LPAAAALLNEVNMSASLSDPSQVRCLTPAVERVMAWHRQKMPFSTAAAAGDASVAGIAPDMPGSSADNAARADAVLEHDGAAPAG